jgi:hypothetical protein
MNFTKEQLSEAFGPRKRFTGFDGTDDREYDDGRAPGVSQRK